MNPSPSTWQSATASANTAPQIPGAIGCATPQPRISVNWRDYDFGRIRKDSTPPTKDLVITSVGGVDLASISVTLTGDGFNIQGSYATTLPTSSSTTVTIQFKPTSYGDKTATIRITSNAVNENPINVQVKGKQYSVVTFIVQEDTTLKKIESVKLKVQQAGQAEQDVTTGVGGKVEVETEFDGAFEVKLGDYDSVLEFRSIAST